MWHVILFEYRKSKCLHHIERYDFENEITAMEPFMKRMLLLFTLVAVLVMTATVAAEEPEAIVRVNAPEFVSGTFEVTIDIKDVTDFDSGQFNLLFNPSVVSFVDVEPGSIGDTEVPIDMYDLVEDGRVMVLFNIKGADGVSGSGCAAKVIFETEGAQGDVSIMNMSDGELVGVNPDMDRGDFSTWTIVIPAEWFNDTVTIGTATQAVATARSTPDAASQPSINPTQNPTTASAVHDSTITVDSAIPSEKSEPDAQELLTTQNFIALYTFIGLFAFIYVLTLLR